VDAIGAFSLECTFGESLHQNFGGARPELHFALGVGVSPYEGTSFPMSSKVFPVTRYLHEARRVALANEFTIGRPFASCLRCGERSCQDGTCLLSRPRDSYEWVVDKLSRGRADLVNLQSQKVNLYD
jgi:hypothetical protein